MAKQQSPQRRPRRETPPINDNIPFRIKQMRVIDAEGQQIGILSRNEALDVAAEADLDLFLVTPGDTDKGSPAVCRILDYGKYKYHKDKQEKAKGQNKTKAPHQLQMHVNIGPRDFDVKINHAIKFLEKGDKVRFSIRLRGREGAHPQLAKRLLEETLQRLDAVGSPAGEIRSSGAVWAVLMVPAKQSVKVTKTGDEKAVVED